jgi:RNA methyltransferase, TrmH family
MKRKEIKYYGFHACMAIWKKRAQDIIRVYLDEKSLKRCAPLLKWCAAGKKAYHIIDPDELFKVSDSVHHEGICILAREPLFMSPDEFFANLPKGPLCLLYLDGVQNPHNIGSIIRSAAHFGILAILGEEDKLPALSPSACRIAKGGAEYVPLIRLSKALPALQKLIKAGFSLIGTSSHGGTSLYRFQFPPRSILALGSESDGVGKEVLSLAAGRIQIPGTGIVESLNVSVAASLCLNEYSRQHSL